MLISHSFIKLEFPLLKSTKEDSSCGKVKALRPQYRRAGFVSRGIKGASQVAQW